MDAQAVALLNTLKRPAASSEAKLAALNALKSDIKHYRVPESAQANIFECLKLGITQQASSNLASSAFSALGHLIKRLKIQDESGHSIVQLAPRLFTVLEERLGDMREPIRTATSQALSDLYPFCTSDVEVIIRDNAIGGSNPRAKQSGMQWVLRMHQEESMPFKSYVQAIVARLEDADGTVRETAKNVVIELFSNAPDRAKTDLKRQLKAFAVRVSIESQILAQIGGTTASSSNSRPHTGHHEAEDMAHSTRSLPALDHAAHFNESINSEAAMPPPVETVQMDPLFVHSRPELEDIFRTMLPFFEGKETEHNWTPRDKSITKLRRITKGNAPGEFLAVFMAGIKSLIEGILKVSNSLRTTMSTNGCHLVQELARTLGPALDPHVEMFLQSFIKMSANTKHIAAENGRQTSEAIFQNCSYNARMMQHIWSAAQEKNTQLRQCTPEWLNIVLRRQASYKSHFESSGGLELAEKCISKGLDDANPKVKEGMRSTYWIFAKTWPDKARVIMSKLDPKNKTALERDPHNPNAALLGHSTTTAPAPQRAAGAASRNALREMMAEQRKAKAAGKLPDRPVSAMAELTPAKPKASVNASGRAPHNLSHVSHAGARVPSGSAPPPPEPSNKKGSSLMSGPVRRPRRPEVARPQTADPYASKRLLRPETPANGTSTDNTPRGTGASKASYPTSSVARNRARHAGQVAGSPSASPVRNSPSSAHGQPLPVHLQPGSRPTSKGSDVDLSSVREDDMTMVMPSSSHSLSDRRTGFMPGHKHPRLGQTASVDSGLPGMSESDEFTMVMPTMQNGQGRARSPLAYRSPLKAMFEEARERIETLSPKLQGAMQGVEHPSLDEQLTLPRSASPSKSLSAQEEVQVFEDPFASVTDDAPLGAERKVLAELPVNENVPMQSPALSNGSHGSPFASPQRTAQPSSPSASSPRADRADILRNRRLLASGTEKIRSKTLDGHGFRRMQDVAKSDLDIWDSGKAYDDLMAALLQYLSTFEQEPRLASSAPHKAAGLKAQALGLVRALLAVHKEYATAWHAKTLVTLLVCRAAVDAVSLVAADLNKAADEILRAPTTASSPDASIDAIVDALPSLTSRSVAMGLQVLRKLLAIALQHQQQIRRTGEPLLLDATRRVRLVKATATFLDDADPEVRKADVELASELFELFGSSKQEFWAEFKGTDEGRLGLLTYYIARRGQAAANSAAATTTAAPSTAL